MWHKIRKSIDKKAKPLNTFLLVFGWSRAWPESGLESNRWLTSPVVLVQCLLHALVSLRASLSYGQKGICPEPRWTSRAPWKMKESYKEKNYLFILKRIKDHLNFAFSILWRLKKTRKILHATMFKLNHCSTDVVFFIRYSVFMPVFEIYTTYVQTLWISLSPSID